MKFTIVRGSALTWHIKTRTVWDCMSLPSLKNSNMNELTNWIQKDNWISIRCAMFFCFWFVKMQICPVVFSLAIVNSFSKIFLKVKFPKSSELPSWAKPHLYSCFYGNPYITSAWTYYQTANGKHINQASHTLGVNKVKLYMCGFEQQLKQACACD